MKKIIRTIPVPHAWTIGAVLERKSRLIRPRPLGLPIPYSWTVGALLARKAGKL